MPAGPSISSRKDPHLLKRLYLLRHGQTEYNVKKLVQGRCNSPLTELGVEQAHIAGAWLREHGVEPDAIVSSPLGRAMQTAEVVASELGFAGEVRPEPGIIERAYGSFEEGPQGAVLSDVWDPGEALVAFGGEGNAALASRMLAALVDDMSEPGVGTLLAVSHGSASLQFIRATLPEGADRPRKLPNCAVVVFDFDEAMRRFEFRGFHDPAE